MVIVYIFFCVNIVASRIVNYYIGKDSDVVFMNLFIVLKLFRELFVRLGEFFRLGRLF